MVKQRHKYTSFFAFTNVCQVGIINGERCLMINLQNNIFPTFVQVGIILHALNGSNLISMKTSRIRHGILHGTSQ